MKRDPSSPEPRNGGGGGGVLPAPGRGSWPPAERSLLCLIGSHGFLGNARRRALDKGFSLRKIAAVTLNLSLLLTPPPLDPSASAKATQLWRKGIRPRSRLAACLWAGSWTFPPLLLHWRSGTNGQGPLAGHCESPTTDPQVNPYGCPSCGDILGAPLTVTQDCPEKTWAKTTSTGTDSGCSQLAEGTRGNWCRRQVSLAGFSNYSAQHALPITTSHVCMKGPHKGLWK